LNRLFRSKKDIFGISSLVLILVGIGVAIYLSTTGGVVVFNRSVVFTSKAEEKVEKKEKIGLPNVSVNDWDLELVNDKHSIKTEDVKLANLNWDFQVDARIKDAFEKLSDAASASGNPITVVSAYRSVQTQRETIEANIQNNMSANGWSKEKATEETMKLMTEPGHSEHNTGLAVDIVGVNYYQNTSPENLLVDSYANDPSAIWLDKNSWKYGFILRYPKGAESITGIDFEPWHFRYVGVENAKYIYDHNLTLEEYISLLEKYKR
jgi:D-alanyl-D-alanine carboxypeptidase